MNKRFDNDKEIQALIKEANKPFSESLDEFLSSELVKTTDPIKRKKLKADVEQIKADWHSKQAERDAESKKHQEELKAWFAEQKEQQNKFLKKIDLIKNLFLLAILIGFFCVYIFKIV